MNSTENGSSESSSCHTHFYSTASKIGQTVTFCLILVVSLVGNSLIVTIVYKTPTLRKPINYFIVNMAMSDLLFPIFCLPWRLSWLHTKGSWLIGGPLGQALCKLVPFFSDVSTVISIQNLIPIAVDRFGAVVFPLRSPLIRSKLCPFFILATWVIAMTVTSPYLFAFDLVEYSPGKFLCDKRWEGAFGESSSYANFLLAQCIVFAFIPVMLLAILYSIILIKLKTQAHPGEPSANTEQQRNRRNRNVLQMSIAIILGFVFCWLPFSINVLIIHRTSSYSCSFWLFFHATYYLTVAYCAINPIICFVFSSNYRQGLKRLINCSTVVQA